MFLWILCLIALVFFIAGCDVGASKVRAKLGDGHTTSGMDKALSDHADQKHPVRRK